jgi:hypothetical protein
MPVDDPWKRSSVTSLTRQRLVPRERARDPDRESGPAPGAGSPGSETRRGVPRAGQPGLGIVAHGDDSGEAPADDGLLAPLGARVKRNCRDRPAGHLTYQTGHRRLVTNGDSSTVA